MRRSREGGGGHRAEPLPQHLTRQGSPSLALLGAVSSPPQGPLAQRKGGTRGFGWGKGVAMEQVSELVENAPTAPGRLRGRLGKPH